MAHPHKSGLAVRIFFFKFCRMKGANYGCSFVAKLSWRKYMFFTEKKLFTEKNINENVKNIYLISKIYFYTENVCVTNKI